MYQIVHNMYQNWLKVKVLLVVNIVSLVHDSYIMKLGQPIAKLVCKSINMSFALLGIPLTKGVCHVTPLNIILLNNMEI